MELGGFEDVTLPAPYHKGHASRPDRVPWDQKRFVGWDGEGMNLNGPGKPQSYVLFGCSTGDHVTGFGLTTHELCAFVVDVGRRNPDAIHVGFAFTYDSNMIVRSLRSDKLRYLHENGFVTFSGKDDVRYCVQLRRGKWFSVTEYHANYNRESNPNAKTTVRIFDIFGFFTCSFVKAVEDMLGTDVPGLDVVREGKARRREFTYGELGYVKEYWSIEIGLLARLAEELRRRMYGAELKIRSWHGPGALASYAMRQRGIKQAMLTANDDVQLAARHGYAGGRFELFRVGRFTGDIYSLDINSAYPYAISRLPSLSDGEWVYVERPTKVAYFGVYHVRLRIHAGFDKRPGPLFHRDSAHNISYPWVVEGWYWSPEVAGFLGRKDVEILEGWELHGWSSYPFEWVSDMYETRRQWKRAGNPSQIALKLCMNSLYGKMAQRIGYDEKTGRIPPWHQLEWAGWVTSYTRSMLYRVMSGIRWSELIAVETDGIYTTADPTRLGIVNSSELGGWEIKRYSEIMYVQSGLAWLRDDDGWTDKRRGLDADTFTLDKCREYLHSLVPNDRWKPFSGLTTRFVGLGAALMSSAPMKVRHCLWETTVRELTPGEHGKRIHVPQYCDACKNDLNAYEQPHDLVIRSLARAGEMSTPHYIPWAGKDSGATGEWHSYSELEDYAR